MIKTKEDLFGTKVRYSGENEWEIIKTVCENLGIPQGTWTGCHHFEGNTVALISNNNGVGSCYGKVISTTEHFWDNEDTMYAFSNLREVDFSEFEHYLNPEKDRYQYKYNPVTVDSIFDLRNMFEDGELYFEDANQGDEQGMVKIQDESTLVILLAGKDPIYTREETTWQDEVEASCSWFEYSESHDSVHLNTKSSIPSEDFLAMCRVVLRANGEIG